ncbi:MAG: hypothetical protein KKI08_10015 [Armatimonadetes bacterium]|nr:hypothetical protein [Armatimonadota bacterium]
MSAQDNGSDVSPVDTRRKGPAEQYLACILDVAKKARQNLCVITEIAETVAERILAGGTLYTRDKEHAFASEGLGRAGGLMLLKANPEDVSQPNALLIGSSGSYRDHDAEQVEAAHEAGDLVVAFCSHQQHPVQGYKPFEGLPLLKHIADYSIDNSLPDNDAVVSIEGLGTNICPAALVVNALNLWTFTAEFVSGCLRKGKMPTMYQSIRCAGSRDRNAEVGKEDFHSDLTIEPIERGRLGKEYLDEVTKAISQIQATQLDAVREASNLAAEALASGRRAYTALEGHMPPRVPGGYGDPGVFVTQCPPEEELQPGDFVALIEYTGAPRERLERIKARGARSVWVGVPSEGDLHCSGLDLFVDPFWRLGDAVVHVPGYDVDAIPPSGVIQSMIYWMLSGETAQVCVDKGLEVVANRRPW